MDDYEFRKKLIISIQIWYDQENSHSLLYEKKKKKTWEQWEILYKNASLNSQINHMSFIMKNKNEM